MFTRKRSTDDFRAEIESHIRMETDRLIASGVPARDAELQARKTFGNVGRIAETFHEKGRWVWVEQRPR